MKPVIDNSRSERLKRLHSKKELLKEMFKKKKIEDHTQEDIDDLKTILSMYDDELTRTLKDLSDAERTLALL